MRILIVEDNKVIAQGVSKILSKQGLAVDVLHQGQDALFALKTQHFDLLILDLGLPDCNGIHILKWLRQRSQVIPVLIVSARDKLDQRILGLNEGADDYLCKPFELDEAIARVHALLRRSASRVVNYIVHGGLILDIESRTITFYNQEIILNRRELNVLEYLLSNVERVISKQKIVQHIASFDDELSENAIETYISRLRKKFVPDLNIRTVRGLGYMLEKSH